MKKTQVVVIGLVRHNGKYLLTKRKEFKSKYHGLWQLPGGGLEFGEKVEECLHRELREELGIEVTNVKYIPVIYEDIRDGWHGVFFNFLCKPQDPSAEIVLDDEATEYGWFTLEEAKQLQCLPGTTMVLEEAERIQVIQKKKCAGERT